MWDLIFVSGVHRKIYNWWRLPSPTDVAFKSNFLSYALKELDRIIQEEVDSISYLLPESDSDESSVDSDQIMLDDEDIANCDTELQGVVIF